ncbi:MAG: response regulator [Bacillota bacterium]
MKVLILDDCEVDADQAEQVLLEYDKNLEIIKKNDPIEAKNILGEEKNSIDLLVLDLNMPVLDGIDILKLMHKNNINIPILVYSNYLDKYLEKLDYDKVLSVINKENFKNMNQNEIADIFMSLNCNKSCMVLNGELTQYLLRQRKRKTDFYDSINELKKELQKI